MYISYLLLFFFFNDTATTEIYTLSLHDALPIRDWASATRADCSGKPRGAGASSRSHSSVHALRSIRAGFPVSDRERIVSRDVAARNFSFTAGWVSASSVVSHTDPHHTPSAPRARAAAIWRPEAIPPAASTGVGATASTTSGTRTIVAISPVCPPASVPWATMRSAPAALWRSACTRAPARAATRTPAPWARSISVGGGEPRALATSLGRREKATSSSGPWPRGDTLLKPELRAIWARTSSGSSGTW